jgi:hypothetical protein
MKDGHLNMVTNQVEEARNQLLETSRPQIVPSHVQGPQPIR